MRSRNFDRAPSGVFSAAPSRVRNRLLTTGVHYAKDAGLDSIKGTSLSCTIDIRSGGTWDSGTLVASYTTTSFQMYQEGLLALVNNYLLGTPPTSVFFSVAPGLYGPVFFGIDPSGFTSLDPSDTAASHSGWTTLSSSASSYYGRIVAPTSSRIGTAPSVSRVGNQVTIVATCAGFGDVWFFPASLTGPKGYALVTKDVTTGLEYLIGAAVFATAPGSWGGSSNCKMTATLVLEIP